MNHVYGIDEAGRGPILGPMALAVVVLDDASTATSPSSASRTASASAPAKRPRRPAPPSPRRSTSTRSPSPSSSSPSRSSTSTPFAAASTTSSATSPAACYAASTRPRDAFILCDGARLFARCNAAVPAPRGPQRRRVGPRRRRRRLDPRQARPRQRLRRDRRRYAQQFGPLAGGGYANAATRRFLDAYAALHGGLPPEARKSWGAEKDRPARTTPAGLRAVNHTYSPCDDGQLSPL
jgi:ribonuclease HII